MNIKHIIQSGLIVASVLVSCKVSRDVSVKDTVLPVSYQDASTDTTNIAQLPWDSFFKDPELNALIKAAIDHNNDLQIAIKDIDAASQALQQAKWGNVPVVGLQATGSTSRPSDNSLNGFTLQQFLQQSHIEDYSVAALLSWEVDIWGKIRSQKAAALAAFLKTHEAKKAVQTRLVSDVAKGYYNLLMLDDQLEIAKKNVALSDSAVGMIKLQYESGQASLLAVQQATAQRLVAAGLIPLFEQQRSTQENALNILTGNYPGIIKREQQLWSVSLADDLLAGIPAQLLSNRPDVRLAELDVEQRNADVGYAKASMYPSLVVTAQGGIDAFKASNWFNIPSSLFGAVAGGVAVPLLNQRKLRTTYEVAKIRRDESVIHFRQSLLVAVGEVSDDLVKIVKFQERQRLVSERVTVLREATQHSHMLFGNGLASYLEVITAQSNVLQSELELAGVKNAELGARVDLYRAVGGGWK
ncbi:efflux transporter, outer membrane factor (OMF) lipoprotein, NodT family [Chitinophaga sp. YR627]|uniref:TolC family protein n=1 Tax=Chitinophaga sp. YR627 TaxID=1881041 RepID=UPI0008ED10CC|nr:efflux transporter outer membrane subunit [Chitinophaga sp. YR627]SFN21348.1 efflux transporter, outer membrane factor (OMF) lipoprotein, NodT family [Chitinophaga sp. YR627]